MKKLAGIILSVVFIFASCTDVKEEAAKYDDLVTQEFDNFSRVYTEYALSANKRDSTNSAKILKMEDLRQYSINQASVSLNSANSLNPFGKDAAYAQALKTYLTVMKKTMVEIDGPKLKLMMKDSLMTAADSAQADEYTKQTLVITDQAYYDFQKAQREFREKYKLVEGESK